MKIYAKQVPPEYQESPLFLGDEFFPDDIAVCGNRDYMEHCPEVFERVYTVLSAGEFDPENDSPLNINGCSVYCTSGSEEGIRKEIADAEGFDPADVVLYAFEGWSRTAQYEEVV